MPIKNRIKEFVDGLGITRYRFQKDTGIAPGTAYNLYDNPDWIPQVGALTKICDFYQIQPGDLIYWIPPNPEMTEQSEEFSDLVAKNLNKLKKSGLKLPALDMIAKGESLPTKPDFCKIVSILGLGEEEQKRLWQSVYGNPIPDATDR